MKKCVAMLLAGGQGSRLKELTKNLAKPAVPFGGKYRIIDFPLSNCTNSGIDTIGVLTQYQPLVLHSYIGSGGPWDLDRINGGVTVLPPYSEASGVRWYKGTASAIYENMNYIEQYDPEYVLILSGDHIYKMNYAEMLEFHIEKNADVSISVIEVPWEETSRFGIMNTNEDLEITEFEEKPKAAKSNLASMGIYIFKWTILKEYLERDHETEQSTNDFGKDIIPSLLKNEKRLVAYPFKGYWKDVGTVNSLWEANMDLLKDEASKNEEVLNLYERDWRIYSQNPSYPPQNIAANAIVKDSLINEGCIIEGKVSHSVIFQGVHIQEESTITESVIMSDATVGKNVKIHKAIVGPGMIIPDDSIIGSETDSDEIVLYMKENY